MSFSNSSSSVTINGITYTGVASVIYDGVNTTVDGNIVSSDVPTINISGNLSSLIVTNSTITISGTIESLDATDCKITNSGVISNTSLKRKQPDPPTRRRRHKRTDVDFTAQIKEIDDTCAKRTKYNDVIKEFINELPEKTAVKTASG